MWRSMSMSANIFLPNRWFIYFNVHLPPRFPHDHSTPPMIAKVCAVPPHPPGHTGYNISDIFLDRCKRNATIIGRVLLLINDAEMSMDMISGIIDQHEKEVGA